MPSPVEKQANLLRMRVQLATAFNPSGPVSSRDLFAGRLQQITQVVSAVGQVGQHVILFGERGVGKTSLASLTHEFWSDVMKDSKDIFPIRYSCSSKDSFGTIWKSIAQLIFDLFEKRMVPLPVGESWTDIVRTIKSEEATPYAIRRFLSLMGKHFIIVIDEFDQLLLPEPVQGFASTIKELSDYLVETTLILVGVADNVDDLVKDYASIERNLQQVKMPRMSTDELKAIIKQGYDRVGLQVIPDSVETMGRLAQGLPNYAHRFAQEGGYSAVDRGSNVVEKQDVDAAISKTIELTNETTRAAYRKATKSNQKGAIFDKVLLACALVPTDDLGYFTAGDVRNPLYQTTKRRYDIPQFVTHLKKFATAEKGSVLQVDGDDWNRRYRFANPLLRPYIVLKGIQDNMIGQEVVERFSHPGVKSVTQAPLL